MKPLSRTSLFLFLFFYSYSVFSQQCNRMVYGVVKDGKSLLSGATLVLKETGTTVTSDEDGHYHLNNVCPGTYTLLITHLGYKQKSILIDLRSNKEVNILLTSSNTQLKDVNISGTAGSQKPLQVNSHLNGLALQMSRGESLGETLKSIPGVNSIQTGPNISKPVIQGLYGNRVLIYNAGVRQEGQQWGSEHAPEVDPFIASQITVVKGAASVMYGSDAIGGVVLVEPAPLSYQPGVNGRVNFVGMSNGGLGALSAMIENSPDVNNHFSWRAQGTARIAGNSKTPDYYLKNTGFREYNGALSLGYHNEG